jgi:hypothetical protein
MKIVEGRRHSRPAPKPLNPYLEFEPEPESAEVVVVEEQTAVAILETEDHPSEPETPVRPEVSATETRAAPESPVQGTGERRKSRPQRGRDRRGRRNRGDAPARPDAPGASTGDSESGMPDNRADSGPGAGPEPGP